VTVRFSVAGVVVVDEGVGDERVVDGALVDAGLLTDAEGRLGPDEHPESATDPEATATTRANNFFDAIALLTSPTKGLFELEGGM
jgi:hypothetical protein